MEFKVSEKGGKLENALPQLRLFTRVVLLKLGGNK